MKKSVLISIKPKWCELIASGKKTVEARKTKPNIETPFKVYIYCTQDESFNFCTDNGEQYTHIGNGKVIGEFVCDKLVWVVSHPSIFAGHDLFHKAAIEAACLTQDEAEKYSGGKDVYGWHISDLVIYDQPKELSEFCTVDNEAIQNCKSRHQSYHQFTDTGHIKNGFYCEETEDWCTRCKVKPLKRPPQSWCYVEEVQNEK